MQYVMRLDRVPTQAEYEGIRRVVDDWKRPGDKVLLIHGGDIRPIASGGMSAARLRAARSKVR